MESAQAEPSATTSIPSPAIIPASAPKIAPPPFPTTPVGPKIAASAPKPFPSTANVATATAQTMPDMGTPVPRVTVLPTTPGQAPKPAGPATPRPNPAHVRANQTPQSAGRGRNDGSPRHHQRKPRRTSGDRNLSKEEDPLRVLVTGFPQYSQAQDISRVFVKFGNVKVENISSKVATLVYTSAEEAKAAIQASKKVNVYGEFLTVRPYSEQRAADLTNRATLPKLDFTRTKQKSVPLDPKQIDFSGDFNKQLERILAGVRLTQEDVAALSTLYTDVEHALQAQWPGCSAIPFGSITTGLGVKTSDADCFVHIPPQFRHPGNNYVMKAKRILQQYPDVFAEILSIPRANTPIVKFFHIPTATNCDLTFKTPLGAQNSKLVAFMLHADPRLIPMAVAIKYWAKVHDFSGTGKLTNYALTLLIIFYLQQPPRSLLPSVAWLQRDARHDLLVDHWNTGFDACGKDSLPPTTNTSSISELLGGFFEYYSMFNFEEMVVCTYLGTPLKKDVFMDLNQLPNEFHRYKNNVMTNRALPLRFNTAVCVQDPFEQCHNVASAINGRLAAEIKAYFKFAANAYEKEKLNNCQNFFETILLQKPKIIRAKLHPEYRVNLFPRIIVTIINPDWKPIVRDIVFTIFEQMLKIKLGKVEEKVNMDTKKEKEKYMGTITRAIWKRKQFTRLYSVMDLPFVEKQTKITEEILQVDKEVFSVQFQVTLTFCHAPRSAVVGVRLGAGDAPAFREFGKFFISVMQGWFLSLLRPHARAPDQDTAAKIADTIRMVESADAADGASDSDSSPARDAAADEQSPV
ncbi:hypothetical protein ABMA27_004066 [Loxostege sticticalis]|uniref:Speckle targeted PIP5K1A-regulated poly(A) polymerase n=1 Tax=Loxostege sticticalis TaxID=481309 RepID=A0ABR3HRB8_LOXSC